MSKKDKSFEEIRDELNDLGGKYSEMVEANLARLDTIFKKSLVYSVLWCIVAIVIHFVWPGTWYFWVVAVIAGLCVVSFAFVAIMRKKLQKTMSRD